MKPIATATVVTTYGKTLFTTTTKKTKTALLRTFKEGQASWLQPRLKNLFERKKNTRNGFYIKGGLFIPSSHHKNCSFEPSSSRRPQKTETNFRAKAY